MKYHIFILLILVLYLVCDNTPLIEGYQQELLNTFTIKQREDLEAIKKRCHDDVRDIIGDLSSLEDLNHEQKKTIIKDIIKKYNDIMKLDVEILNEVSKEMLEEDIYTLSDEEKNRKRENLKLMMDEFNEYYNVHYNQATKDRIHQKYKEFRENQSCDKECNLKNNRNLLLLSNAKKEINKQKLDLKKLQIQLKKIKNRVRIKGAMKIRKKYCDGRKLGRHPRHCGGRKIRKHECEKTYKKYRGKNLKCQYVNSRRSCDFWQPGRPHTKQYCS